MSAAVGEQTEELEREIKQSVSTEDALGSLESLEKQLVEYIGDVEVAERCARELVRRTFEDPDGEKWPDVI